jgi:hypothetical protein
MIVLTSRKAMASGYHALTVNYQLPRERWMLNNVLDDMRRGDIDHVLVPKKKGFGVAVWRRAPGGEPQLRGRSSAVRKCGRKVKRLAMSMAPPVRRRCRAAASGKKGGRK